MMSTPTRPHFLGLFALALLALPLLGGGCTALLVGKAAKDVLDKESTATFTFEDGSLLEGVDEELFKLFGVDGYVKTLETGAKVLKLHGQYQEMMKLVAHLVEKGLQLLASDEFSEGLLIAAISFLRAAG